MKLFEHKKKRGALIDLIFIIVFMFGFALVSYISLQVFVNFRDSAKPELNSEGDKVLDDFYNNRSVFDAMVVLFMTSLGLLVILSAAFIRTLPVFFWISLFLWIFAIMIAGIFSNSFETFSDNPVMSDVVNDFPMTNFMFDNLILYITTIGLLTAIVLYIFFPEGRVSG
jgi:hypothetical protein